MALKSLDPPKGSVTVVAKLSLQIRLEQLGENRAGPLPISVAALWERYRTSADDGAREELIRRHLSLVHLVARRMAAVTSGPDYGELVSTGTIGLLSALDAFDPACGHAFSTYAVGRIRGAILDDLRRQDWMPRSIRSRSRRLAAARTQLESRLLRAPGPLELAVELGISLEAYGRWCEELDLPVLDRQ